MQIMLENPGYRSKLSKIITEKETAHLKRYVFIETQFHDTTQMSATIINMTRRIKRSPFYLDKKEEESNIVVYMGKYLPAGDNGKITKGDVIDISEVHYNSSYIDPVTKKNHETYLSYDYSPYTEPMRLAPKNVDNSFGVPLETPFPQFFTKEDQIKNWNNNEDFGTHLNKNGKYRVRLLDLLDDGLTTVSKINFDSSSFDKLLNNNYNPFDGIRGDEIQNLYSVVSMCKYSLEVSGFRKGIVIFDTKRGFNVDLNSLEMFMEYVDPLEIQICFNNLMGNISDIFEYYFKTHFGSVVNYKQDFVLYMYFEPYTNTIRILLNNDTGSLAIPLSTLTEEISSNKNNF